MLTGDGILGGSQGLSHLNEKYFKDISENPSLENILKTVGKFTSEDLDDPELKEIQALVKDVMKEDLKIENPFDML
mgnify:CR=1 FL=1